MQKGLDVFWCERCNKGYDVEAPTDTFFDNGVEVCQACFDARPLLGIITNANSGCSLWEYVSIEQEYPNMRTVTMRGQAMYVLGPYSLKELCETMGISAIEAASMMKITL